MTDAPINMWAVLANIYADLKAWADPAKFDTDDLGALESWVKPDGGFIGCMYGTPKLTDTHIFEEGGDEWGSVMWCEVEYNHYGNRATYGIRPDGSVSCYMN